MNTMKRICRVLAVMAILSLSAGVATSGDRVTELCVIAGDIDYCAPQDRVS